MTAYSKMTNYNVRRTDITPANPSTAPDPNKQYVDLDSESNWSKQGDAIAIAKEAIK